jgi:BMFP domain-containing protein YqiC
MSMAGSDITIEILKDIRDEIRGVRTELRDEIRAVRTELSARLDTNNQRLDLVESTLLDLAAQQRFVVRYTKAIAERDTHLEPRVSALEERVEKLESR